MNKVKTHSEETVFDKTTNGIHFYEYFTAESDGVVLRLEETSSDSTTNVYITFIYSDSIPDDFKCTFTYSMITSSITYASVGAFTIDNNYSADVEITFTNYSGQTEVRKQAERLAGASTSFALASFNNWMVKELKTSFKAAKLFPKLKSSLE